jgi:hypothetical protein
MAYRPTVTRSRVTTANPFSFGGVNAVGRADRLSPS